MKLERGDVSRGRKSTAAVSTVHSHRGQIQHLCERIAREFNPEKIILFGSHAYGQPTSESDLDLLVVMQFDGDPLEQAVAILHRLNVLLPIDLLVRTPTQIQQRLEMGDSFIGDIIARGQVMYEAHHA
jgi:predicted nucleotidyltransferase